LKGTNLSYAKLEKAKGLKVEQLCESKTLYKTKLDSELLNYAKNNCPELLLKDLLKKCFIRIYFRS